MFKSGFIALVGRPNSGKSTLLNAIIGQKVSITSNMAQTTRHALRGIYNTDHCQAIFVDTPGLHKPHDVLGQELNESAIQGLTDVDIIIMMIDGSADIGKGDKWVSDKIASVKCNKICCINKIDLIDKDKLNAQIEKAHTLNNWDFVVALSADKGTNLENLTSTIYKMLPEGPVWFDTETVTDQAEDVLIAEIIREKVIGNLHDEVPHSIGVQVDSSEYVARKNLHKIYATIYCERDSQRGIIIGSGGKKIKDIGSLARADLEDQLGAKVFLDLSVKLRKNWRRDLNQIRRFGYGEGL